MKKGNKKINDVKLNKMLKTTFIIFVVSAIMAIVIILNKGIIFGKRLVSITSGEEIKPLHVIQIVATNNYLKNVGDSVDLKISIDGRDVINGEGYELTCSDEDVISLKNDTATALALGNAVITVRSTKYDIEESITLNVVVPANKINLDSDFKTIKVGESNQIYYTTRPTQATGVEVRLSYTSSDNSIATVDSNGMVVGKSEGTVTITGTDKITGLSDSVEIKVK